MNFKNKNRLTRVLVLVVLMLLVVTPLSARNKKSVTIYAFAYGMCFNDSVTYLSSVATLNNAEVDNKTNFLTNRSTYSSLFKTYLDSKDGKAHTTAVLFNKNRDKLEKTYLKIKRNVQKNKSGKLVEVSPMDFKLADAQAVTNGTNK